MSVARTWMRPTRLALGFAALAIVLGAAAAFEHLYAGRGANVSWRAEIEGETREIGRTTERRAQFPNERRALARYVQAWNFDRDGIPADLFPFEAKVRTQLEVPRGGREVHLRPSPRGTVRVDGEPFRSGARLSEGVHDVQVTWEGSFDDRNVDLVTYFCRGPAPSPSTSDFCDPAPLRAFTPPHDSRAPFWVIAVLLALAAGVGTVWLASLDRRRRGRWLGRLALVGLVALGLGVRLYDYDVMPDFRENGDELFATWNGWSLLESGETRGWSLWANVYRSRVEHSRLEYFGMDWNIIQPYFEHPPLTHLLVGAAAHLGGAEHFAHSKLSHTRLVPILLMIPTLLLMFGIGRRVDPRGAGPWLACMLYAVTPTIALQTRVIKEEALLGPLGLGAVYAVLLYKERESLRLLILAGVLAGAATWAKVTGFAFVPAIIALLMTERRFRAAAIAGTVGVLVSGGLLVYGAAIDWETFRFAQQHQGTRPLHFNIFLRWFDVTLINHSVIGRGWMLFLWLGTAASHARRKVATSGVVLVPLLLYLSAITIGTGNWTFGWYAVPLYPWLCLGAGRFLADLWDEPDFFRGFLTCVLLGLYSMNFLFEPVFMKQPANWPPLRLGIALVIALLFAPFGLVQVLRSPLTVRIARGAVALLLVGFVVLSARFVLRYETFFDSYKNFDRDVYFDR
ncbi:MAG: glycosyltransferase family 39 protein [Sandaracinus sp.]|nr:glycosyltransferase family 39 protein [Sandaracinus sp.]MCB9612248.1 glycosyltransferase family 39 protein [Sandaracinus sp.]